LVGLIRGIMTESSETMVMGFSRTVLSTDSKDGADTFALDEDRKCFEEVWILCLNFMGLSLSNSQITEELELDPDSTHEMATLLRNGILAKEPNLIWS